MVHSLLEEVSSAGKFLRLRGTFALEFCFSLPGQPFVSTTASAFNIQLFINVFLTSVVSCRRTKCIRDILLDILNRELLWRAVKKKNPCTFLPTDLAIQCQITHVLNIEREELRCTLRSPAAKWCSFRISLDIKFLVCVTHFENTEQVLMQV